jgi:thioredoxin 1
MNELTDKNFDAFIRSSDKPAIVDVWASWCGPCSFFTPIIEEVAREHAQHISVGTLNVDDYPEIAQRYSVMSIPTVLVFVNGRIDKQVVGAYPKDKFVEQISQYLGP